MGYNTEKLEVKPVLEAFELLGSAYAEYHQRLDDFDQAERRRFLPRSLAGASLLDIGSGDGRTYRWFEKEGYGRYVACDISPVLLRLHPGKKVERCVADLEGLLPFEDGEFDVITTFFVFEYIRNLEELFYEVYRMLSAEGRWIFTFFPQRREFVHSLGKDKFKIKTYPYGFDAIEAAIRKVGFEEHSFDLFNQRKIAIGKAYCLMKS